MRDRRTERRRKRNMYLKTVSSKSICMEPDYRAAEMWISSFRSNKEM